MTPLCSYHAFDKCRARLLCLWDSPSKNTGVGCHFFLQGIFPTQGSNPCVSCDLATEQRQMEKSALKPGVNFLAKVFIHLCPNTRE